MTRAAALEESHAHWLADAVSTIRIFAQHHRTFTAEDLSKHCRPAPHSNLPGMAFSIARRQRIITTIGYRPSTTKTRNRGVIRIWTAAKEES